MTDDPSRNYLCQVAQRGMHRHLTKREKKIMSSSDWRACAEDIVAYVVNNRIVCEEYFKTTDLEDLVWNAAISGWGYKDVR